MKLGAQPVMLLALPSADLPRPQLSVAARLKNHQHPAPIVTCSCGPRHYYALLCRPVKHHRYVHDGSGREAPGHSLNDLPHCPPKSIFATYELGCQCTISGHITVTNDETVRLLDRTTVRPMALMGRFVPLGGKAGRLSAGAVTDGIP